MTAGGDEVRARFALLFDETELELEERSLVGRALARDDLIASGSITIEGSSVEAEAHRYVLADQVWNAVLSLCFHGVVELLENGHTQFWFFDIGDDMTLHLEAGEGRGDGVVLCERGGTVVLRAPAAPLLRALVGCGDRFVSLFGARLDPDDADLLAAQLHEGATRAHAALSAAGLASAEVDDVAGAHGAEAHPDVDQ